MTTIPSNLRALKVCAILSVILSAASSLAKQPARTKEYTFPGGVDRVTFDPSRVNLRDLNRWMELSPVLGNFNFMIVPEPIDLLCKPGDPRYHCPKKFDAEAEERNPNLTNARLNLDSIKERIKKLSPENYPPDLSPVVEYLRKLQSMYLWMHEHEWAFLETNDVGVLKQKYGEVEPQKECESVIQRISSSGDLKLRSRMARSDWYNCVLVPVQKKLGPYPIEQWKSFLATHGIQEKEIEESPD